MNISLQIGGNHGYGFLLNSSTIAATISLIGVLFSVIISSTTAQKRQKNEKQREYYIEYIRSVMALKQHSIPENQRAYELARVNLLMFGSCKLIANMHEYESLLVGKWDDLTPVDNAERAIILQSRADLGLSNKGFPKKLYLFTISNQ